MRRILAALLATLAVAAPAAAIPALFVPYTDQTVTAADGDPQDGFGGGLAIDGARMLVGASGDEHGGENAGTAYVMPVTGGPIQAKLVPPGVEPGDRFGAAVDLDGDVAVVGAPLDDEAATAAGAAYVYRADSDGWTLETKLVPEQAGFGDFFGASVALSADHLAVAAPFDDDAADDAGSVTVYDRDGWTRQAEVNASDAGRNDRFGRGLAWAGSTLVVGAPSHDGDETLAGAVYTFDEIDLNWTQTEHLDGHRHDAWLGWAVDATQDRIVAGAPRDETVAGEETGLVVAWTRGLDGEWSRSAEMQADPLEGDEWFGRAVALNGHGLAVGAPYSDGGGLDHPDATDVGSVHVLSRVDGLWVHQMELVPRDAATDDRLGVNVALRDATVAGGAPKDDVDGGDAVGSVRVWRGLTAGLPP